MAEDKPWLFKPGQSGNPSGRPKSSVRALLREMVLEAIPGKDITYLQATTRNLLTLAANGDLDAIKAVFDQIDGKPIQVNDNTNRNASLDDVLEALREVPDNVRPMPRAANE